jgi:hypothetical protein
MVRLLALLIALVGLVVLAQMTGLIDINTRGELRAPAVNVSVRGGELPDVKVNTAKVEVGTTEQTVKLPDVDIDTRNQAVKVPTVEVDRKADAEATAPQ